MLPLKNSLKSVTKAPRMAALEIAYPQVNLLQSHSGLYHATQISNFTSLLHVSRLKWL